MRTKAEVAEVAASPALAEAREDLSLVRQAMRVWPRGVELSDLFRLEQELARRVARLTPSPGPEGRS